MKTCPNCKATGIPDNADFCPICGKKLIEISVIYLQKYNELTQQHKLLIEEKNGFERFQQNRDELYKVISNNDIFLQEKKRSLHFILRKRFRRGIFWTIGVLWLLLAIGLMYRGEIDTWWEIIIVFGLGVGPTFMFIFGEINNPYKNDASIPGLIKPFLYEFKNCYAQLLKIKCMDEDCLAMDSIDYDIYKIWKYEAFHSNKISTIISEHIKELKEKIKNIDIQLEIINDYTQAIVK